MVPADMVPCGIGVDLVEIAAFARKLTISPALLARTFTEAERTAAGTFAADGPRSVFLAGRFAAKEAVLKTLGLGISGAALTDVEVTAAVNGAPTVQLRGAALASAARDGISRVLVSISHDGGFAVAFAVAA